MKKPKSTIAKQVRQKPSKLEKAKERFLEIVEGYVLNWASYDVEDRRKLVRQLNNLIRLAKEEGRAKK